MQDTELLLTVCSLGLDYSLVKDVVVSYLIANKVHNPGMVRAALEEFKVDGLFFRGGEL